MFDADERGLLFRYDGLVLVMSTDEAYLIVPRTRTYRSGTAIVLPRDGVGAAVLLPWIRQDRRREGCAQ